MLGKLIKLDIRFAYKKFLIMAGLMLALGLVMPYVGQTYLQVGAAVVFAVVMTVIPLMSVWLVVQHFQRNLFGSEGYLMFTLPVRATELLLSKLVTTVIWFNLMIAAAGVLVVTLFRAEIQADLIRSLLSWEALKVLVHLIASINVNIIPIILAIFMGISLSTVAVRNKRLGIVPGIGAALAGIGPFLWSSVKLSGWNFLNLTVNGATVIGNSELTPIASELINLAVAFGFAGLFFLITTYVMRQKLNIE